jgi:hypothetical protein
VLLGYTLTPSSAAIQTLPSGSWAGSTNSATFPTPDHALDGVDQGDQDAGLTPAVLGVEPEE